MKNEVARLIRDIRTPNRKTVVFSLVANAGTSDGRVMKQALALKDAGYDVWLYGRLVEGSLAAETVEGVNVRRLDYFRVESASWSTRRLALSVFGRQSEFIDRVTQELYRLTTDHSELTSSVTKAREAILGNNDKRRKHSLKSDYNNIRERMIKVSKELKDIREQNFYYKYYLFAQNLLCEKLETIPDIIHAHDLMALPGAVALAKRTGARVVFDAHEIETERTPPLPPEKKKFIFTLEEDLFKKTDQVVVCCDSAADFYFELFRKRRPVLVMNAPDERYLGTKAPEGQDVRSQSGVPADTPLIVYTGSVGLEARGVDMIVKALRYLPGYHLAIQGPRNPRFDDWLRSVVEQENCQDRVHFLRPVPQDILIDTLRTGDVGVCAFQDVSLNHRYALPNKVFEMAFAGLPLCLSDLVEMRKFIKRVGNGVTMDETDPKAIATAIKEVYENRSKYQPKAQAWDILRNEYSWTVQAKRLRDMYLEMGRPSLLKRSA